MNESTFVINSLVAGFVATFACGLGVFPVLWSGMKTERRMGLGYAFAGGLMFAASVYNLLLPAFSMGEADAIRLWPVIKTLTGLLLGCAFIWWVEVRLTPERLASHWFRHLGGRTSTLVFIAMLLHSIPEGIAVGVGFGSAGHANVPDHLGLYIAVAIAIHNIPEGLAIALPMRADGASINRCFWAACLTSLPQPIAAVPASLLVWFFEPLMLPFLGFAAGAMMYLVIVELIPHALRTQSPGLAAWAFMLGFALMVLVQVTL